MVQEFNSKFLAKFLSKKKVWFRLHEFEDETKTAIEAGEKIPLEMVVKSIVLVDSNQEPLLIILPALRKIDTKKVKKLLGVRDVRLATPQEVLEFSGYPVGAVPPVFHKKIKKFILDKEALKLEKVFAGGGETNKLIELRIQDIKRILNPLVAEVSR